MSAVIEHLQGEARERLILWLKRRMQECDITIEALQQEGHALISVKDTGVGIPDAVKPNLFVPLFTTKAKGQGLGLAVVKRLIDALGGTVAFESQKGKSTTFTIKLPVNPKKPAPA